MLSPADRLTTCSLLSSKYVASISHFRITRIEALHGFLVIVFLICGTIIYLLISRILRVCNVVVGFREGEEELFEVGVRLLSGRRDGCSGRSPRRMSKHVLSRLVDVCTVESMYSTALL